MDKVAVVILNWNGLKMLEKYLRTVVDLSAGQAKIYVADNASSDVICACSESGLQLHSGN